MKSVLVILALVSANAFAIDAPNMKSLGDKAMKKGKAVVDACKKEKVEFCKEYSEIAAIKECLTKNKEKIIARVQIINRSLILFFKSGLAEFYLPISLNSKNIRSISPQPECFQLLKNRPIEPFASR